MSTSRPLCAANAARRIALVLGQHLRVAARPSSLEQLRRALDVGEEERDGAGRNLPRSVAPARPSQLGILRENRPLQAFQLLTWLEPQLLCEHAGPCR